MTDNMNGIVAFNIERGLTTFRADTEIRMLLSEIQELAKACADNDTDETINALCDIIVLAAGAVHKLGYDPDKALSETVAEILSRKGSMDEVTGKWEKDKNQDPSTLYTPNYENARYQ